MFEGIEFELNEEVARTEDDYKRVYYKLFNGISGIIENTHTYGQTIQALKYLQCLAEDLYISLEEK